MLKLKYLYQSVAYSLLSVGALLVLPENGLAKTKKTAVHTVDGKSIVGYIEFIQIPAVDLTLKAKLDTGAKTSSIHADIIGIREETEDDPETVVFTVSGAEKNKKTLERKIERWVRIKKKDGGFIRRPVILMEVCINGVLVKEETNLADRGHFLYEALIGRNMLSKAKLLINPSKTYMVKATCPVADTKGGQ